MDNELKRVYRVVITQNDNEDIPYLVHVPDFEISTQGKSLFDAIHMARDAISLIGVDLLKDGGVLPEPYSQRLKYSKEFIETLIDVDFGAYQEMLDNLDEQKKEA